MCECLAVKFHAFLSCDIFINSASIKASMKSVTYSHVLWLGWEWNSTCCGSPRPFRCTWLVAYTIPSDSVCSCPLAPPWFCGKCCACCHRAYWATSPGTMYYTLLMIHRAAYINYSSRYQKHIKCASYCKSSIHENLPCKTFSLKIRNLNDSHCTYDSYVSCLYLYSDLQKSFQLLSTTLSEDNLLSTDNL